MGYEVTYHYHEQVEGEYNKEETKTKTVKVGSPYEEVSLESLAGKIMSQLARRNILVVDVEIYEFTKKKLTYKEASDGILIKNRKFKFDDGTASLESSPVEDQQSDPAQQLAALLAANPQLAQLLQQPNTMGKQMGSVQPIKKPIVPGQTNLAERTEVPIRYEVFDPDPQMAKAVRQRGLKFKVGGKYPIYQERQPPGDNGQLPMNYVTQDDDGNKQILTSLLFVPERGKLEGNFDDGEQLKTRASGGNDSRLDWGGAVDSGGMPSLR